MPLRNQTAKTTFCTFLSTLPATLNLWFIQNWCQMLWCKSTEISRQCLPLFIIILQQKVPRGKDLFVTLHKFLRREMPCLHLRILRKLVSRGCLSRNRGAEAIFFTQKNILWIALKKKFTIANYSFQVFLFLK